MKCFVFSLLKICLLLFYFSLSIKFLKLNFIHSSGVLIFFYKLSHVLLRVLKERRWIKNLVHARRVLFRSFFRKGPIKRESFWNCFSFAVYVTGRKNYVFRPLYIVPQYTSLSTVSDRCEHSPVFAHGYFHTAENVILFLPWHAFPRNKIRRKQIFFFFADWTLFKTVFENFLGGQINSFN